MALNDIEELKDVKAYVIRSEKLNRTYTVFIDVPAKKFMYCLVETGSAKQSLVYKESLEDVLYEIRLHGSDICKEFESVINRVVDSLLVDILSEAPEDDKIK